MSCTCGHPGAGCSCWHYLIPDPPKKVKVTNPLPPRVERKATITLSGTSVQVGHLIELLEEFPETANLKISVHGGTDQRDPAYATLTIHLSKL